MKRITTTEDAYKLAGAIIAYTAEHPYFTNRGRDIFNDGETYARVSDLVTIGKYDDVVEKGLSMDVFIKANSYNYNSPALMTYILENVAGGYLHVRYATPSEVRELKYLVEHDQVEFGDGNKEKTIEDLTNYLAGEIPPYPWLRMPVQSGMYTHWEIVDPYKMSEETNNEAKIIGGIDQPEL